MVHAIRLHISQSPRSEINDESVHSFIYFVNFCWLLLRAKLCARCWKCGEGENSHCLPGVHWVGISDLDCQKLKLFGNMNTYLWLPKPSGLQTFLARVFQLISREKKKLKKDDILYLDILRTVLSIFLVFSKATPIFWPLHSSPLVKATLMGRAFISTKHQIVVLKRLLVTPYNYLGGKMQFF